jgi:signal transduction histidine kinase
MRVSVLGTTEGKRTEEEETKLETQLRQSQKMEAIATLAGGIAHQFNNALVGITGNIELLEMDLSDNERIDTYIEPMKASINRMSHLTNQLLAYARGGKYQPRTTSLSDFVRDTLPLLKHNIDLAIQIETDLQFDICDIEADLTQMQMLLSAVVTNAVEALEGEGNIRIITREEEIVTRHFDLKPGSYVCLRVSHS